VLVHQLTGLAIHVVDRGCAAVGLGFHPSTGRVVKIIVVAGDREQPVGLIEDQGHIANWLLGENDVARSLIAAGNRNQPQNSADLAIRPDHIRFPLLAGFAGEGRGDYIGSHPEIVDFVEVTREWASQELGAVLLEAVRVITARGDSMRGQYNDGDLVFVDSRIQTFDADSAYVYRWNSRVQIKRLQFIGQNRVRILSKNPDYPVLDVDLDELEIGGRALAVWTLKEF
jgi:hypothetical protein